MNFLKREPLIILIAGRARSGKSILAECLKEEYRKQNKKVVMSPYTKYLKHYIEEITGEKIQEENKPRDLLQQISSEVIKGQLGKKNFFIDRQIEDIEIYSYFADVILVPDVRFPEEIKVIKEKFNNVVSIGVIRKNYISTLSLKQQTDITEVALDGYHDYDFEVENTEKTNLYDIAKDIINKINLKEGIPNE
ncbi:MAG: hypothetical protein IJ509_02170 [Bacilli bacterium]|nr:hypothetical protein [Bacilli bacterium]